MIPPEVYASGSYETETMLRINGNDKSILSGPNYLPTRTNNLGGRKDGEGGLKRTDGGSTWYCLDLLGKYNRKSLLKQFHALTFYFRDTTNGDGAIIASMLPESFTYSIGGKYGTPIKLGQSELVSAMFQSFTNGNVSLSFGFDTAQIWNSTKQMDLVFRIPVIDDSATGSNINYQEAIDLFGEAILPELDAIGQYESIPGPNIIKALEYRASHGKHTRASTTFRWLADQTTKGTQKTVGGKQKHWDRISVQVGGLLLLDWCIIKDLKVTFPNTKAMVLHNYIKRDTVSESMHDGYGYRAHLQPIQAELEVTVSTVMGITRATFKDMLYQNESVYDPQTEEDKNTDVGKELLENEIKGNNAAQNYNQARGIQTKQG